MTGLDDQTHRIIEVAVMLTDWNFKKLDEYHQVVFQEQKYLDAMDEWCTKTHGESGLTKAVAKGKPLDEAEKELLELIDRHYAPDERVVIAGNSVGNDKRFIDAQMPKLASRLHYRIVDISSFKEVFVNRYGIEFEKKNTHRALDDIVESIEELKAYLFHVSAKPIEPKPKAP